MSQAVTRYNVLFDSIRSRRRRPELPRGLDNLAAWCAMKVRTRRVSRAWLRAEADRVLALAPAVRNHSDAALNEVVREIRDVFVRGRQDDAAIRQALALVREIGRRETGEEAFAVQVQAALALYHGRIVEMLTGEGKTLTGSLAAPLIAWQRRHLHVFTVNDYLAARDAESRRGIYERCGLTVGTILQEHEPPQRAELYARSIVYGTPKQITADWLRDQIRLGRIQSAWTGRQAFSMDSLGMTPPMVPGLRAALVDEADAVLIDEGVVPLIIARSRREDEMAGVYRTVARIAERLDEGPDYSIDHVRRRADLRRRGVQRCEQFFREASDPVFRARRRAEELVRQALVARHCYLRGHQYQVVDGRVVIVDEYTGRFLPDRSWEHGLHQAVEAKEGLEVTADRETLARMSFQRFFRSYPFLCGMTGTAADATREMERIYSRPVTVIPTNRPMIRRQWPTRFFRSVEAKWSAIIESVEQVHLAGRPILIGTRSIEASEYLSRRLAARGLEVRVLNADHDKEEAELIAAAGRGATPQQPAAITVATNMAGRGTDIKLDEHARRAGGLHVILTEMHTAKRIDRQFIGRAGRQGDPGSAQIFVSFEDELLRLYLPRLVRTKQAATARDELPSTRLRQRLCRLAQARAEARARRSREAVLRQDDWIDKHLPGA